MFLAATGAFAQTVPPAAQPLTLTSLDPSSVSRGQVITVKSTANLEEQNVAELYPPCVSHSPQCACQDGAARQLSCIKNGDKSCSATIPLDLPLGAYLVRLFASPPDSAADYSKQPSLSLTVTHGNEAAPVLLGVTPQLLYPPDQAQNGCKEPGCISLLLTGSNFSLAGRDNRILWNGNELDVHWGCGQPAARCADGIVGTVDQSGTRIKLSNIPIHDYRGISNVAISVAGGQPTDPKTITISSVSQYWPLWIALAVIVVILGLLWLILRGNSKRTVAGKRLSKWTALMLDPETDTYSLSKFQFYVWTLAAVLGYVYLTAVRSLIQGHFEFSDVPPNLPTLLGISAGTWVVATGVGTAVGPKGAGPVQPGWPDLLTIGGVVVPERVQFVVWTIVGVLTFITMILFADPGSLQQLPGVPQNFLLLMGVSSAGYLGGKLVRGPGPVINTTVAHYEGETVAGKYQNKLTIDIIGQNLARSSGIRLNGGTELKVPYVVKDPQASDSVLEFVTRDENASDDNMASHLRLTIRDQAVIEKITAMQDPKPTPPTVPGAGSAGAAPHTASQISPNKTPEISVTNPDGQMAAWPVVIPNG
jgi:hypothetical protein